MNIHQSLPTNCCRAPSLSRAVLRHENRCYSGSGGVSRENSASGFVPAFRDSQSGEVYRSCFSDGRPAPMHMLEGLPAHLLIRTRDTLKAKQGLVSGFLRRGVFFTRAEAAAAVSARAPL